MVIFYKTDFLDLKYPPEVQVEPKTCITIFNYNHTTLTGLAGGAREGQNIAHLGHINAPTVPYFDLPLPLLPTRSNFYGSKMAGTGVLNIAIHVLGSTCTSGGYFRSKKSVL